MSPRQFGKVDVSATWAPCSRCPHKHPSTAECPPTGVWLTQAFCNTCNPVTGYLCRRHRDLPPPGEVPHLVADVDGQDAQQRAAGEREEMP